MKNAETETGYKTITETPDTLASEEQIRRLYTRYRFACDFAQGRDVLEAACGAGQGLGLLSENAASVTGTDIDETNLDFARKTYTGRRNIKLQRLDAHETGFKDESFGLILLYEAIYYLDSPEKFMKEALRLLKKNGTLLIGSVNCQWADFNPSPFSKKYFSAEELKNMLSGIGFSRINLYGDCKVENKTARDKAVSLIKRAAVAMNLMPKTMKGKELFKRIFMGRLSPLPAELTQGMREYKAPIPLHGKEKDIYKVIFAEAVK